MPSWLQDALKIPFLQGVRDCLHQEKFDGSGYPRGLRGDQIPLGRASLIADTLDAITSDHRPTPQRRKFRLVRRHPIEIVKIYNEIPDKIWLTFAVRRRPDP
jgi:HD-GYP domain-containing protein (c-di-GMP phosphodiesterase class II)